MKRIILLVFFAGVYMLSTAQVEQISVESKKALKENIPLIDELLEVSNFENYYIEYCTLSIQLEARKRSWSTEEINSRIKKINFIEFKESSIYNAFSDLTKEELKSAIKLTKKLNRKAVPPFYLISNTFVQLDLVLYVKSNYLN